MFGVCAANAQPSESRLALLGVAHEVQVGRAGTLAHGQEQPHLFLWRRKVGRKVVWTISLFKKLAVVPGFRGAVHHVPELEASGIFIPWFLQLRLQHDVFLSPTSRELLAHGVIVQVLHDSMGHLPHLSDVITLIDFTILMTELDFLSGQMVNFPLY